MQLRGVLTVLLLSLCTAHGLKCYKCENASPENCTETENCAVGFDRCSSTEIGSAGLVTKTCMKNADCVSPISCCEAELCNGAIPTGPSAVLLLVSSAIITLFI